MDFNLSIHRSMFVSGLGRTRGWTSRRGPQVAHLFLSMLKTVNCKFSPGTIDVEIIELQFNLLVVTCFNGPLRLLLCKMLSSVILSSGLGGTFVRLDIE